jgi:hypothetical protein
MYAGFWKRRISYAHPPSRKASEGKGNQKGLGLEMEEGLRIIYYWCLASETRHLIYTQAGGRKMVYNGSNNVYKYCCS